MTLAMNPEQLAAVHYVDGPCLVLAGAGSGKTRVITQKIAYLIRECGYAPQHVVALTFTNKAAQEMTERVAQIIDRSKGLTICTFHALGLRFLREEAEYLGLKKQFSILDSADTATIIQELLNSTDKMQIRMVQQCISLWKNALKTPDQVQAHTLDEKLAQRIYRHYDATLRAYQSVDFDDLIRLPVQLMRSHPEVCERWQDRMRYLLIDEYQDTNVCQYEWVKLLTAKYQQFTAVGDDDQAIYAWRGATLENLAKLTKEYPQLKLITLEQNYRSVDTVLQAANRVIAHNPNLFQKTLWSTLGEGEPIQLMAADNDAAEADSVVIRIITNRTHRHARWSDFAVLYRGNHQARVLEQAFRDHHVPYRLSGGQSFFDRAEIRDMLAYVRLIANPQDDPAFIRAITTPRKGVGQQTLQQLATFATQQQCSLFDALAKPALANALSERQYKPLQRFGQWMQQFQLKAHRGQQSVASLLDELIDFVDYERYLYDHHDERSAQHRWQYVLDFWQWLKGKADSSAQTLPALVQQVALITMLDRQSQDEQDDRVTLSTLHAAKGLEFPYVYLVGVEEGLLPHFGDESDEGDSDVEQVDRLQRVQEERRLMYVGITRAQKALTVSWCRQRRRGREWQLREPSRFIEEMGLDASDPATQDPLHHMSNKARFASLKQMLTKGG